MSIVNRNYKYIIAVNTCAQNKAVIKSALSSDYKILYAENVLDAMKYLLKYEKNILEIIVDATEKTDNAITFIREWESDIVLQIIPLVCLVDFEKRDIEQIILEHSVSSILYSPFTENRIKTHTHSTARRYALNETRIQELYDSILADAKEKVFLISEAVDTGIGFIRVEEDKIYLDYTNNKYKSIRPVKDFDELLDVMGLEEGARLISLINRAKLSYEPVSALMKVPIDGVIRIFDTTIKQIPNIDKQVYKSYVYKFVISSTERTVREKYKDKYERNSQLFKSVLENISGGVMVFSIIDKKLQVDYVSDGIYKLTGYPTDKNIVAAHMLPASTVRKMQLDLFERIPSIMMGTEETLTYRTKIICANHEYKHATITIAYNKYDEDKISAKCLVIDDTETYNYAFKLKKLAEFDADTGFFNSEKFMNASTKLFRSNDELEYRMLIVRIYKYDELVSFFGKEKVIELLNVVRDGMLKYGPKTLKGRVDNKAFALSYIKDKFNETEFIKNLDDYVKDNYSVYQVKLYYGIYDVKDVYESVEAMIIQTTFAIKEIEGNALKNSIYCDSKLKSRFLETDNITNEMRKALDNNEFEVFLQPVFDLKTRKILSAEALTRWHHPKRGYIPPSEYVPIFEENGFIVNIDNFVWESVCKLIRGWLDNGLNAVPVSVNVSRIDLFSIDFYTVITELIEKYEIPVEYFRLEITESAFVLNEKSVVEIVDKLRRYGFKILMDDFGSGYSSLNSLKFINVDFLKIDMDLVKGIEESIKQANILKSVINLGTTLNLELICEGVETEKQASFVNDCGCEKAQGWLFSKAIPVDDFNKKMGNN